MNKKDITPYNENRNAHGYWEVYRTNGSVWYKCFYNNGKEVGYLEHYWMNDNKVKKYYYI